MSGPGRAAVTVLFAAGSLAGIVAALLLWSIFTQPVLVMQVMARLPVQ